MIGAMYSFMMTMTTTMMMVITIIIDSHYGE